MFVSVLYISLLLFPALLAWLVNKCLFGLISHRTLGVSILRRKFPACVAPSWCYFQGMVCRLQQIGLDGGFFLSVFSRDHLEDKHTVVLWRAVVTGSKMNGLYLCSCVCSEKNMREKLRRCFWFLILTCFTTDVLTWLLNSAAEGGQRAKTELRRT